jgi:hypothetical protein
VASRGAVRRCGHPHAVVGFAQEQLMMGGIGRCAPESQVRIGLAAGIRTLGPSSERSTTLSRFGTFRFLSVEKGRTPKGRACDPRTAG